MESNHSVHTDSVLGSFQSPTFGKDGSFHVNEAVGSASISPSGRDVVLGSREGLHIIDLDNPFSPPRHLPHRTPWEVADVQWSPFASRDYWVVSTSNQKALVWNLDLSGDSAPIQYVLHAHSRAITDINFSAHDPDKLATCAIDSFVHCWDFRQPSRPVISFADWYAGATQVKWNRQDPHIIASSHDKYLHIWDERKADAPLKTINAHATKIYGIDWNRTEATSILTCSPDRTIKFWDTLASGEIPTQVIRTNFPVWRARHTPFGYGVLAMPQRGNCDLHLYYLSCQSNEYDGIPDITKPVHSFVGHNDQVKEFLWRTQGAVEDGMDLRAFQLVSWSSDRNLLLHRVDDDIYEKVGFEQGGKASSRLSFTRKGAIYRTFHQSSPEKLHQAPSHGLSTLFRAQKAQEMKKAPIPLTGWDGREFTAISVNGMRVRSVGTSRDANPIEWMKGVKIGDSLTARDSTAISSAVPWESSESLGDEIALAGDKYRNVKFEKVDMASRLAVLSLSGPWGVDDAAAYIKATIIFPSDYPDLSPADIKVERTSSVSDASFTRINVEIKVICEAYASIGKGCVEPALRYLLGECDLQQSLAKVNELQNALRRNLAGQDAESSSDEDDDPLAANIQVATDMEGSATDVLGGISASANANVPLPKACGALWADDGRLICFFPPKTGKRSSIINGIDLSDGDRRPRSANQFESFASLPNIATRDHKNIEKVDSDSENEFGSSSVSSTAFSSSSIDTEEYYNPFKSSALGSHHHFDREISPDFEINMASRDADTNRQLVSLHDFRDLLPSKQVLAKEYQVSGDARKVCEHNTQIAAKYGLDDLANIWHLLSLILCDEVPLEAMAQFNGQGDLFVLARRALVHIRKRDSGLDLAFDEPEAVINAKIKGRVKWGNHPLAGQWMVDRIFRHFEELADIQMLAMLSCVLCESERHNISLQKVDSKGKPALYPPHYFPSQAAALSSDLNKPPVPARVKLNLPGSTAFGSFPSSNGLWSSDDNELERKQDNSGTSSPLAMSRQNSHTSHFGQSLSSSPERSMHRSNSTASNAFAASFSKQFASFLTSASSSPPNQSRTPELSTSAPTSGGPPHGVTWGRNIVYQDDSRKKRAESFQSAIEDYDSESPIKDNDEISESEETIIVLKNQHLIDDEACLSMPLLKLEHEYRYRAYREAYAHLLYIWGLPLMSCEILKFNTSGADEASEDKELAPEERDDKLREEPHDGLHMVAMCLNCGAEHVASPARPARCERCSGAQAGLPCSMCGESVHGLYKSCLVCGHVTHFDCVITEYSDNELASAEECRIGCGCLCDDVPDVGGYPPQFMTHSSLRGRTRES